MLVPLRQLICLHSCWILRLHMWLALLTSRAVSVRVFRMMSSASLLSHDALRLRKSTKSLEQG